MLALQQTGASKIMTQLKISVHSCVWTLFLLRSAVDCVCVSERERGRGRKREGGVCACVCVCREGDSHTKKGWNTLEPSD